MLYAQKYTHLQLFKFFMLLPLLVVALVLFSFKKQEKVVTSSALTNIEKPLKSSQGKVPKTSQNTELLATLSSKKIKAHPENIDTSSLQPVIRELSRQEKTVSKKSSKSPEKGEKSAALAKAKHSTTLLSNNPPFIEKVIKQGQATYSFIFSRNSHYIIRAETAANLVQAVDLKVKDKEEQVIAQSKNGELTFDCEKTAVYKLSLLNKSNVPLKLRFFSKRN